MQTETLGAESPPRPHRPEAPRLPARDRSVAALQRACSQNAERVALSAPPREVAMAP